MSDSPPTLSSVSEAIRARRAVRRFTDRALEPDVLNAILDDARHAPSGYNLQPTHFVVVEGEARAPLSAAAFDQRQVLEAPVTVVLVVDTRSDRSHLEPVLAQDLERGSIDEAYANFMRRMVGLSFGRGPLGVLGSVKACATRLGGWLRPLPEFPAADPRGWAARQAMLVADHLLLSATSRGVASCPMEGFGEARVRRVLDIPRPYSPVLLIPLGYADDATEDPRRSRLPLERLLHRNRW